MSGNTRSRLPAARPAPVAVPDGRLETWARICSHAPGRGPLGLTYPVALPGRNYRLSAARLAAGGTTSTTVLQVWQAPGNPPWSHVINSRGGYLNRGQLAALVLDVRVCGRVPVRGRVEGAGIATGPDGSEVLTIRLEDQQGSRELAARWGNAMGDPANADQRLVIACLTGMACLGLWLPGQKIRVPHLAAAWQVMPAPAAQLLASAPLPLLVCLLDAAVSPGLPRWWLAGLLAVGLHDYGYASRKRCRRSAGLLLAQAEAAGLLACHLAAGPGGSPGPGDLIGPGCGFVAQRMVPAGWPGGSDER